MELIMGPSLVLAVLVAMGFHVPRESERAVIFRFGRVARGLVGRGEERVPAAKCNAPSPSKLRRSASAEPKSSMRRANEVDIFPAPNLDAGNILAKNMTYLAGATLAGIVIGARVPLILTSGSDLPPLPCCSGSVGWRRRFDHHCTHHRR